MLHVRNDRTAENRGVSATKLAAASVLFPLNSIYTDYKRILVVPGLSSSWGSSRVYEALHFGRTVCLAPPGAAMLHMAGAYAVDTILASPQQALVLAELQEKVTNYPLPTLKTVQLGASAITRGGVLRIKKHLCREVIMIYGSTEAGVVATAPYDMIANTRGAVGYVLPGVDVEIVDDADRLLPAGREGFVRVRSPVLAENLAAAKHPLAGSIPAIWAGSPPMGCSASPGVPPMF